MDIFLLILGIVLMFIGLIGSFIPVLPGPMASWLGLAALYYTEPVPANRTVLWVSLVIVIILTVVDNFIPAMGTKKFGGSKAGTNGSLAGALIGLFFGPLGIIFGPFVGALIGELLHDSKDFTKAFKAALGSFLGFLVSTGLKIFVCFILLYYFMDAFWPVKGEFFGL